ncbi:MAG TPA: hypothetical protein PLW14_05085 [Chlorobiota bacterium]|nr:hypothetical protein [Chlorobiota bacterium]
MSREVPQSHDIARFRLRTVLIVLFVLFLFVLGVGALWRYYVSHLPCLAWYYAGPIVVSAVDSTVVVETNDVVVPLVIQGNPFCVDSSATVTVLNGESRGAGVIARTKYFEVGQIVLPRPANEEVHVRDTFELTPIVYIRYRNKQLPLINYEKYFLGKIPKRVVLEITGVRSEYYLMRFEY